MKSLILILTLLIAGCSDMEHGDSREKKRYIEELGYSDDPANASKIANYLNDEDPDVVMSASYYLGYLKGRDYIDELVLLLDHENPKIVNMAGSGLSQMVGVQDEYILPNLYKVLSNDFLLARISAIEAIGAIQSPSSIPELIAVFEDPSSAQKGHIISALGNIGDPKALPLLEAYLQEINKMDHSVPNKGGVRGSDLHPKALQHITEQAISAIKQASA